MKIGKVFAGLALLVASGTAFSYPTYIDATGREWLDPNVTRSQKWLDVASVCNVATGSCNGQLEYNYFNGGVPDPAGLDLSGYMWATRDEVRDLFYELGELPSGSLDSYRADFARADGYGANAFSKVDSTLSVDSVSILNGFTRTVAHDPGAGDAAYLGLIFGPGSDPFFNLLGTDTFDLSTASSLDAGPLKFGEVSMGAYLYKPSTKSVPEPYPLALAAIAGLALAGRAWRQRAQKG